MKRLRMDQKWALFILAFVLFGFLAPNARADSPFVKLGRGFANLLTSPAEFLVQTVELNKTHDPVTAAAGGFFQGGFYFMKRIAAGIYEIVTFPIPIPREYRPVMRPETPVAALSKHIE